MLRTRLRLSLALLAAIYSFSWAFPLYAENDPSAALGSATNSEATTSSTRVKIVGVLESARTIGTPPMFIMQVTGQTFAEPKCSDSVQKQIIGLVNSKVVIDGTLDDEQTLTILKVRAIDSWTVGGILQKCRPTVTPQGLENFYIGAYVQMNDEIYDNLAGNRDILWKLGNLVGGKIVVDCIVLPLDVAYDNKISRIMTVFDVREVSPTKIQGTVFPSDSAGPAPVKTLKIDDKSYRCECTKKVWDALLKFKGRRVEIDGAARALDSKSGVLVMTVFDVREVQ